MPGPEVESWLEKKNNNTKLNNGSHAFVGREDEVVSSLMQPNHGGNPARCY